MVAPPVGGWQARGFTDLEVRVVTEYLAGEGPLDRLFCLAVFGQVRGPRMWRDWPKPARDGWDRVVWLHRLMSDRPNRLRRAPHAPTLESAYAAIRGMAPDPEAWWELPGMTWPELAPVLGVSARAVYYHLVEALGWRFAGRGPSRRAVTAPCVTCGGTGDPRRLSDAGLCPTCVDRSAAPRAASAS